jgi:hypothetical protein
VKDALKLGEGRFASVIDSGLFHFLPDDHRQRSVEGLATVLEPVARTQLATTFKNCCEKVEQAATTYM